MTPERMAELRRLAEAATPGPWRVSMSGYSVKSQDADVPIVAAVHRGAHATADDIERWLPNADLIATARTAIPELLAEVDRLKRDAETAWANEAATSELLREAKADRDRLLVVVARLLEYGEAAMTDEDWAQLRALAGGG